jgi:hypothetical protein
VRRWGIGISSGLTWRNRAADRAVRCGAIVSAAVSLLIVAGTRPLIAQTRDEAPKALPETTIAPAPTVAAPPGTSAGFPEGPPPAVEAAPAPVSHHRARPASIHKAATYNGEVEPANAKLKLSADTWGYGLPAKSSSHVERLTAGKYVMATGTTRHYVRVKLKDGRTAYVPISTVELSRPTDKVFKLTKNTPVLSEPNHFGKRLAEVHQGHDVHVIGTSLNYMKIKMRDGLEGYIAMTALE